MNELQGRTWDIQNYLQTEEDIIAYLDAALEEQDMELLLEALGDIARAKGMAELAEKTGLGRESLYKTLSSKGNPLFITVMKIIKALGFGFHSYKLDKDNNLSIA